MNEIGVCCGLSLSGLFSFRYEYSHNTNMMLKTIEAGFQTETALAGGTVVSAPL